MSTRIAALATCAAVLMGLLTLHFCPARVPFVPPGVDPFMASIAMSQDSAGQKLAHKAVLATLGVFVLLALRAGGTLRLSTRSQRLVDIVSVTGLLGFFALSVQSFWEFRNVRIGSILDGKALALGLVAAPAFLLTTWITSWRSKLRHGYALLVVAALGMTTVPGFFETVDLSKLPGWHVDMIQWHFALVVTPGDRLAAGFPLFDLVTPQYGLLLPTLACGFEKHFRQLSLGDYVQLVRAAQAAYLTLGAYLLWRHSRRRLDLVLLALLGSLGWYHFNQSGLMTPNLTPWRLLGFPLGLLALWVMRHWRQERAALALGHVAGWLVVLNMETGIAIAAGEIVYLFFRYREQPHLGSSLARFALGVAAAFLGFVLLVRACAGEWPDLAHAYRAVSCILLFERTGFGGTKLIFDPFALLIFAHSIFVLVEIAARRRAPVMSSFARSFRASVAATLLVWFAYYANRPGEGALPAYYLLYGFLLMDLLRPVTFKAWRKRSLRPRMVTGTLVLALVLVPQFVKVGIYNGWPLLNGLRLFARLDPEASEATLLSGVYLRRRHADELREKAAFVEGESRRERFVYLTANTFFIPKLTGVYMPFPFADTFVATEREYEDLLARIAALDPDVILFDDPSSDLRGPGQQQEYYEKMKTDVSGHYARAETVSGWEAWRRKPR